MRYNDEWKDYQVIATANGEKLERWGKYTLLRPDPQVIWKGENLAKNTHDAHYKRENTGGGSWKYNRQLPQSWTVDWRDLRFKIVPMGFKQDYFPNKRTIGQE